MPEKKELTVKQAKFVEEYLVDLNAAAAARRAGYSERTARHTASEYLAKHNIQAAIAARRQELAKNTVTPEWVLEQYAKIAATDIKDFLRFGTEKVQVGTEPDEEGVMRPIYEYRQVVDARPSSEVDGTLINEVSISDKGTFKFKLHDKLNALEKIAKHLGMFVEKHEHTGAGGGPLEILQLTAEERQAKIDELIAKREGK